MNNHFNWTNIISLNSSQNDAFEELLCQLAKKELIKNKKEFIKVGNPDGGVECYITLTNGDEIGFQAKWFLSTPQDAQWNQVEKSFKTTLKKHPKMITYYIAIPLDRADPKIDGQQWFMDKWNEKIKKWKQFAINKYNRDIEFIYWGSSEFITRLSREENAGLKRFFFGDIDLSDKWFRDQNNLAIKDLDARYTPEINIELDILANFDSLSRNKRLKKKFDDIYHNLMVSYRAFLGHLYFKNKDIKSLIEELTKIIDKFEKTYCDIQFFGIKNINDEEINQLLEEIQSLSSKISELLDELNKTDIEGNNITTSYGYRVSTQYDNSIRNFDNYLSNLYEFKELINSNVLKFINNPFMILDGEAGIGKSHLLADVVSERMKENFNSIFLLGQHFREDKSPWSQIFDLLQLKCNKEELLGALNAKAEIKNKRIIIFIDAINEGKGRSFWNEFLIGFIESIKKYEWLGLVLSVRSSYFNLIVPKKIFRDSLAISIKHFGFDGVEYNASKLFFENYNILQPSIPLLHPEFSNPLFLKLFCEGLSKKGLTQIPDGYEGISNIIKFFIEGIEEKLLKKYTNIKTLKLIDKVIDVLIHEMISNQVIPYEDAYGIVEEKISSRYRIESGLLDDLISEGLLTKNIFYKDTDYIEGIYFVYERFEDHLKVKYLFENYLDKENPKTSFKHEQLNSYFQENNVYYYKGIIEAMSIQLPEVCDIELFEIFPKNKVVIDSFFNSLLWRKVESITANVTNGILKNISNIHFQEDIFKVLLSATSNPSHPLNAIFLYDYLSKFTMKERDTFLIPLLNNMYLDYDINSIKRLIDWSWSDEDKSYISNDSILLTSITLSWFLTSSNRQLRDYATKALISILQDRVFVVLKLLKKFENVEEPYIYERLFAVAFGVVVNVEKNDDLEELGEYIYKIIFDKEEVYPHILLRDYAKNTIEYIYYLGVNLDIDLDKTKPPYNSFLPKTSDLPTNDVIDKYKNKDKNYNQNRIISSMITEYGRGTASYGNFGRYTFGSALHQFECKKNEQLISNYATQKIFEEYGYDGNYFNEAEKNISDCNRYNYDRDSHKIERIGKKYQWMAFYETLARVTDNFIMYDGSCWGKDKKEIQYQGSFEPYVRDVDPTILLKETKKDKSSKCNFWWNLKFNFEWSINNEKWISFYKDIPNIKNMIEFVDENNKKWISLNSYPEWREPVKKGHDRWEITHKYLWNQLRSYIIPKKDLEIFKTWAKDQNFYGRWMPETHGNHQMFSREYYWSSAYKFFQNPYYCSSTDWTEVEKNYTKKIALTTENYFWEEELDCSKKEVLNILKPSKMIFNGLKMRYAKRDGEYIDKDNNLICFEASVNNESLQSLLVDKEKFLNFLNDNELTIFWVNIGEKRVFTKGHSADSFLGLMEISSYAYLEDNKLTNGNTKLRHLDNKNNSKYISVDLNTNILEETI